MEKVQRFVDELAVRTSTPSRRSLAFVEEIEELQYEEVRTSLYGIPSACPATHAGVAYHERSRS